MITGFAPLVPALLYSTPSTLSRDGKTCSAVFPTGLVPATRHSSDLRERELQKDLLLLIYKVNSGPVHRHDHVVLGQTRSCGSTASYIHEITPQVPTVDTARVFFCFHGTNLRIWRPRRSARRVKATLNEQNPPRPPSPSACSASFCFVIPEQKGVKWFTVAQVVRKAAERCQFWYLFVGVDDQLDPLLGSLSGGDFSVGDVGRDEAEQAVLEDLGAVVHIVLLRGQLGQVLLLKNRHRP